MTFRLFPKSRDVQIETLREFPRPLLFQAHNEPVFANREANSRRRDFRSERLRESIVAAAAQNRILRAKRAMHDLKRRSHVIIQPSHKPGPHFEIDFAIRQKCAHFFKMIATRIAQVIEDRRKSIDDGLILRHLAIEHPQRVRVHTPLAIATQPWSHFLERLAQTQDKLWPAIVIADRINQQLESIEASAQQYLHHHLDHLGVHGRRFRSNRFGADLKKLPVAALLRALPPEHRPHVVELRNAGLLVEPVFEIRAHHRRRGLGSQRQRTPVAILERVHLLAHDVGVRSNAAREKLRLFENRRANLSVIERPKNFARSPLDVVPDRARRRQNISCSLDCFQHWTRWRGENPLSDSLPGRPGKLPHSAAHLSRSALAPRPLLRAGSLPEPPSTCFAEALSCLLEPAHPPRPPNLFRYARGSAPPLRFRSGIRLRRCTHAASPDGRS